MWLCDQFNASHLIPDLKFVLQKGAVFLGPQTVTPWLKMPSNGNEGREKALRLFGGLEAPHLLFTQSRGLMRIFRTIVQAFVLAVLHARQDLAFRRSITPQLIGDNHTRNVLQSFEKLAEKPFRRFLVPSALRRVCRVHCHPGPLPSKDNAFSR